MSPAAAPTARNEPLVWLQLLGPALFPLEALALLLALAGEDPGPFPVLERLLCWAIGAVAPAVLLARRPADGWSLLLAQVPLRGRRPIQQRLSAVTPSRPLALASLAVACLLSLLLLNWVDGHAAVATAFSPVAASPRLVGLLLAALLLALMQWQWQQALQALVWLSTPADRLAAAAPIQPATLDQERLSLGIPLLLLNPLRHEEPARQRVRSQTQPQPQAEAEQPQAEQPQEPNRPEGLEQPEETSTEPDSANAQQAEEPKAPSDPSVAALAVAIEPEQPGADENGDALDQQIS